MNFESFHTPAQPSTNIEDKKSGMEGVCTECSGEGRIRAGFLKGKRVCAGCHGKGFIKKDKTEATESYDWNTGKLH